MPPSSEPFAGLAFMGGPMSANDELPWTQPILALMRDARTRGVPAYVVFQDATLREIAKVKPTSLDQLRGVSGVGEKKLVSYGEDIVGIINEML